MAGIGNRIKRVRVSKGIAVATIAAAAGVTRQAVHAWESGDSKSLKGANLLAVARALDVSAEWLSSGKGAEGRFLMAETAAEVEPLSPEAIAIARAWSLLSPARREQFALEMRWAEFFERKFPTYRLGVVNRESHDRFERSVEADWDRMMRQGMLNLEE